MLQLVFNHFLMKVFKVRLKHEYFFKTAIRWVSSQMMSVDAIKFNDKVLILNMLIEASW